jgi:hypothetical protein
MTNPENREETDRTPGRQMLALVIREKAGHHLPLAKLQRQW